MSKSPELENFHEGKNFTAYRFFGCHKLPKGYVFRVWAPHAKQIYLILSASGQKRKFEMSSLPDGECFEVKVSSAAEGDIYQYEIITYDGRSLLKSDPYAFKSDFPNSFCSVVYDIGIQSKYDGLFSKTDYRIPINIYEVNLLSWKRGENNRYLSYSELEQQLVPYVKDMGYTHVEFMPITEFPYDGSWGYQVTGYFAPTGRLGEPYEFARLIDAFHRNGIKVIIDWVPAHFPKDEFGLYEFDGQPLYESPLWDRMEHQGWGTRKFDFGRGEVDSFLLSSAYFFFDVYHIDGLRVDAVASMLYLDYDKNAGDFTPNIYGDNRNLEAIEFLKKLNFYIKNDFIGAITVAEESTSFDGVTRSVADGGLGFDYKWNMGWMNDVLFYCRQDPYFRNHHHNKLTFSLVYSFSERFILPLSHDEVVHVKGSIVNKMSGEYADKFAGERELLAFMYAHPGKKLNFMGYEIAQFKEWDYREGIEFFLTKFEKHALMTDFVRNLNYFYRNCRALYEVDDGWDGFEWLVVDDRFNNLISFNRYDKNGESLTAIANFSGVDLHGYGINIAKGKYRIALNTDDKKFGGEGKLRKKVFYSRKQTGQKGRYMMFVDIPRLTCMYLIKEK